MGNVNSKFNVHKIQLFYKENVACSGTNRYHMHVEHYVYGTWPVITCSVGLHNTTVHL